MDYSFLCEPCDAEIILREYQPIGASPSATCPLCGGRIKRMVSSPSIVHGTEPHFNVATNTFIQSDSHYKSELSRLSDEMSERTGANHKYVPVDLREREALGVTDEGLDTTAKRMRDSGETMPTRRIIV